MRSNTPLYRKEEHRDFWHYYNTKRVAYNWAGRLKLYIIGRCSGVIQPGGIIAVYSHDKHKQSSSSARIDNNSKLNLDRCWEQQVTITLQM